MFLVKQRETWDCGIAVVATLAGIGYQDAIESCLYTPEKGMACRDFVRALGLEGVKINAVRRKSLEGACAALVRERRKSYGHYVAIDGDHVFDPELGEFKLSEYPRKDWEIIRVFARA